MSVEQQSGGDGEGPSVLAYGTADPNQRSFLFFAWDLIVGLTMILCSLAVQVVVIGLIATFSIAGIVQYLGLAERWVWVGDGVALVLLNWLTFWEFKRLTKVRSALRLGSALFLLPRGIYRIRFGRETYFEVDDETAG